MEPQDLVTQDQARGGPLPPAMPVRQSGAPIGMGSWLIHAILSLGLAGAFYAFFMTTKHDAVLSQLLPFAFDPYDAIGSFAVETAIFLALLSIVRTLRLWRTPHPHVESQIFLVRTHLGIMLAVLLTLVGDVVAMLRHLPTWTGQPGTGDLVLVVSGMGLLGSLVGIWAVRSHRRIDAPRPPREWAKAILVGIAMVAILAFYPEQIIHDNVGELVTVVVGAVLLYVPMWAWGEALMPAPRERSLKTPGRSRLAQWLMVILIAMGIGLVLVLGEATESSGGKQGIQVFHALHVVAVYVGLEVAAVLIGYGLLHTHLGLFRSTGTIGEERKVEQGG